MCGINGIFAYGGGAPPVDADELMRSRECMRSRGPDAADVWISDDGRVGLEFDLTSGRGSFGTLVLFGQSSGAVPPVDPQILNTRGFSALLCFGTILVLYSEGGPVNGSVTLEQDQSIIGESMGPTNSGALIGSNSAIAGSGRSANGS